MGKADHAPSGKNSEADKNIPDSSKCDICGETFGSERARNIHRTRAHRDSKPWTDRDKLYRLYWDEGLEWGEIAERFGCSTRTIHKWLRRHDIPLKTDQEKLWDDEDLIRSLYKDKQMSESEIGEMLGCSQTAIYDARKRFGIPVNEHRYKPYRELMDKEKMENLYRKLKFTTLEIAEMFDCSDETVRRWLHIHDIDVRRPSMRIGVGYKVSTSKQGYEVFRAEDRAISIHRMVALAHGKLTVEEFMNGEKEVHHINKIPWDNRPSNLEVMEQEEHMRLHRQMEAHMSVSELS